MSGMSNTQLVKKMKTYELPPLGAKVSMNHKTSESHGRSIAKALSWRFIALIITFSIAWIVTGKVYFAATIGGADVLLKLGIYYFHERAWNRSSFGRRDG